MKIQYFPEEIQPTFGNGANTPFKIGEIMGCKIDINDKTNWYIYAGFDPDPINDARLVPDWDSYAFYYEFDSESSVIFAVENKENWE